MNQDSTETNDQVASKGVSVLAGIRRIAKGKLLPLYHVLRPDGEDLRGSDVGMLEILHERCAIGYGRSVRHARAREESERSLQGLRHQVPDTIRLSVVD